MSKKFLLFFIVLANFLQLYSQEFISKTYTSQDNLPDNYIYSLERYENGYLWAGTSSGLSKYNGNKFETIISKDSLENIFVTAQYFSKNHGHWLGLYDGTISKVINDTIYTVLIPEGSFGKICGIAEDSSQNTMYFLSTYGSIYAINEKDTQEFQLNIESLSKMLQFENNIYILSDRGIFLYRGKNLVQQYAFGKINDFQIDKQEKAIVEVSDEGLSLRSLTGDILSKFRKANGLLSNRCSKVYVDKNNIYILHYALGISIINKKSKKISVIDFSREKGIPELNYSSFMVDKEGIFWLGSYGNGIVKFEYSLFNTIETGFKEPITAITKDSLGNIWVSTERKVYYNSEYTFLNTPFKEILTIEGNITSLCKAYNNELWIGTKYQGVYIYNFVDDTKKNTK
jgi:ligand-binding sensor domain-containing protein